MIINRSINLTSLMWVLFFAILLFLPPKRLSAHEVSMQIHINDPNIYTQAMLLVQDGASALKTNNKEKAKELLLKAQELYPNLPQTYFYLALANFSFSIKGIINFFHFSFHIVEAVLSNIWWFFFFMGTLTLGIGIAVYTVLIMYIVFTVLANFNLYLHDITENWKLILLLIPSLVMLPLGPVFPLLGLVIPLSIYLNKKQTVVFSFLAICIVLFIIKIPLISSFLSAPYYQPFREILFMIERTYTGFETRSYHVDKNWTLEFNRAMQLKENGNCLEAIEAYKSLMERKKDVRVYNNAANCYVILNDYKSAKKYYDEALAIENNATVLFNLSQILRESFIFDKAEKYFDEALSVNQQLIKYYKNIQGNASQLIVIDLGLKRADLVDLALKWKSQFKTTDLLKKWFSNLSTFWSSLLIIGLAIFPWTYKKQKLSGAYMCKRCGSIFCNKCEKTLFENVRLAKEKICRICYKTVVRADELDPKVRVEKLLGIQSYRTRRNFLFKVYEILLPGSGHIYFGYAYYGTVVLLLYIFCLTLFSLNLSYDNLPIVSFASSLFKGVGLIGIVLTYITSQIIAYRRAKQTWL